jgi:hypothetical protein
VPAASLRSWRRERMQAQAVRDRVSIFGSPSYGKLYAGNWGQVHISFRAVGRAASPPRPAVREPRTRRLRATVTIGE